ncbi:MAG: hypothetical protein AAFO82_20795, partial [Bacteroidota bacterium]
DYLSKSPVRRKELPLPIASNKSGRWLLYTEPFSVKDVRLVESKAIRLGWKESESAIFQL